MISLLLALLLAQGNVRTVSWDEMPGVDFYTVYAGDGDTRPVDWCNATSWQVWPGACAAGRCSFAYVDALPQALTVIIVTASNAAGESANAPAGACA